MGTKPKPPSAPDADPSVDVDPSGGEPRDPASHDGADRPGHAPAGQPAEDPTIEDLDAAVDDEDATVDDLVSALGDIDERDGAADIGDVAAPDRATDIGDLTAGLAATSSDQADEARDIGDLVSGLEQAFEAEAAAAVEAQGPETDGLADLAEGLADADKSAVTLVEELPIEAGDDLRNVQGEASPRLVSIIESLLFAATKPLTVRMIRRVLKEPSARQIQLALKHLIIETAERGICVTQVAGGFVLRTSSANAQWVQRLLKARPVRLSRPQLETLAVASYRQPVTKSELDHIRGVDSGAVLRLLVDKDLVKVVGRKEEPGRPLLYGTTVFFLEFFNLMSLRDLPDLRDFRELSDGTKELLRDQLGEDEAEALGQEVLQFAGKSEEE